MRNSFIIGHGQDLDNQFMARGLTGGVIERLYSEIIRRISKVSKTILKTSRIESKILRNDTI